MRTTLIVTCSALLALGLAAGPAAAATPELDTGWAQSGKLFGRGQTVLVQADGRLITWRTLGDDTTLQLTRFTADGALDRSFGSGGYARVVPPQPDEVFPFFSPFVADMAEVGDGRLLLLISFSNYGFEVVRLQADGTFDPSFGDGGAAYETAYETYDQSRLAVGPGGRFAVAVNSITDSHAVLRYRADGSEEPVNPVVQLPYLSGCPEFGCEFTSGRTTDLYYRPDGKLGVLLSSPEFSRGSWIVQLTARGDMDPGWSGDGLVQLPFGRAYGLVLAPGGDLLVSGAGLRGATGPQPPVRVARVTGTGTGRLRASFGHYGLASAWNGTTALPGPRPTSAGGDLDLDEQGRIVVAGRGLRYADRAETYCSVTRFTGGGRLDGYSRDHDGTATDGRSDSSCSRVTALPGGRYLVSGRAGSTTLQEMLTG